MMFSITNIGVAHTVIIVTNTTTLTCVLHSICRDYNLEVNAAK